MHGETNNKEKCTYRLAATRFYIYKTIILIFTAVITSNV
jgi:hypothetical protein